MIATRVGAGATPLTRTEYQCQRCGIRRECSMNRPKPELCQDCYSVERVVPQPERVQPQYPTHLTDAECRAARNAKARGDQSPEVEAAVREYWRRDSIRRRARREANRERTI